VKGVAAFQDIALARISGQPHNAAEMLFARSYGVNCSAVCEGVTSGSASWSLSHVAFSDVAFHFI